MRFAKLVMGLFKRRPQVINLSGGDLLQKAIYTGNHCAADGPIIYELCFPLLLTPWGAHQMCGTYRERWNYLYHIYYMQKLKYGKLKSCLKATILGFFSIGTYRGIGLIPTYQDARLVKSLRFSMDILNCGHGLLIFPENSNDGYKEILEEYNCGFVTLSKLYYKLHGEDLPVYNVYFSKRHRKMVIGEPHYLNKMLESGMTENEVARFMMDKTNKIYLDYILPKKQDNK